MAARVLMSRRAAAPLMAAALTGGALYPAVALAEAPASVQQVSSRKPIYDDFEAPLPKANLPVPSPASQTIPPAAPADPKPAPAFSNDAATPASQPRENDSQVFQPGPSRGPTATDRLAVQIGNARMFLYHKSCLVEDYMNNASDRAFNMERSLTSTIASLAPSRESGERLMPGLVYTLVASMAGSVVARNRNIIARATFPLIFGITAGWALIPVTMGNTAELLWTYERRFPAVADAHLSTRHGIEQGLHFARVHRDISRAYVENKVADVRATVEGWVSKGQ